MLSPRPPISLPCISLLVPKLFLCPLFVFPALVYYALAARHCGQAARGLLCVAMPEMPGLA